MIPDAVDETGLLLRRDGGFVLQRDRGGYYRLELHRMPVDLVEKRVRVIGRLIDADHVDADGVQPA
ncbi:DUF5818 domain-containing protein [Sphingomonadaceae bacterium G21617-S1]|uniref:DUF5818 domain-containing protein n=1 Tax=Rhizorhabdus sp. TaxID=1968843 RepID=UPI00120C75A4|nr:DUF5818 domain-containing protein [Rhizorhabdus sp.]MCZ4342437.1 DUF5818 domain-containing protein [Sphingomonadaceae bacterium G21617-S1]TAK17418.1 MAG: hypothetical protein EPO38_00790 [Rhizorhabdus sp.]